MTWQDGETVGIVRLGHVGLPLALYFAERETSTIGVDVDARKLGAVSQGRSSLSALRKHSAVLLAIPTPLAPTREPDLRFVIGATRGVAPHVKKGMRSTGITSER